MKKCSICTNLLFFASSFFTHLFAQSPYVSSAWSPDLGNGNYKNPIIYADYSDPDLCRVGDDYFLTASSFNCVPGLPILHSQDLVNWEIVNYALQRLVPEEQFNIANHGCGVWAPAIRFHNNEFYIFWGDPDNGIYMVKTSDIYGNWDEPILVKAGKGLIDTCPIWTDDNRCFLVHGYAGSRAGLKSILGLLELSPDGTTAISNDKIIYDGHEDNVTIEGPKIYFFDGYYYIMCPAGGVKTGWQLAMRSTNIDGPYEWKVVMAQRSTNINGPHQGGLVDTPDGKEWWFINFQDLFAYGRVLHLNPVNWQDGWPIIGANPQNYCGEPVTTYHKPNLPQQPICNPSESDNFTNNFLSLQWQWHANPQATWFFTDQLHSRLRLFTVPNNQNYKNLWDTPNLLLQKFPAPDFTVTIALRFTPDPRFTGERAGFVVMGMDYATLVLENTPQGIRLTHNICTNANHGETETQLSDPITIEPTQLIYLRLIVKNQGGKALCSFAYSFTGTNFTPFPQSFEAREGKWIGAKFGFFATRTAFTNDGGYLDIENITVE